MFLRDRERRKLPAPRFAAGIRRSCRPSRYKGVAVAAAFVLGATVACTGSGDKITTKKAAGESGGLRYLVRGEIVHVPRTVSAASPLMIRHEAIPNWVNRAGQSVGMEAMTMGFTLAPGAAARDLVAGDKIEFTIRVDWERNSYEIFDLKKLPPDTPLRFSAGEAPGRPQPR